MLDKEKMIRVTNRSYGRVVYDIQDLGVKRTYEPGETKDVTFEELLKLSYSTGGKKLIEKYLIMDDEEAVNELLGDVEPEYYYNLADVKTLLEDGSLDQLDDCLRFGGPGVIDMVKKVAVEIDLNDMRKRELIQKITGYNVNNAIEIKHIATEDDEVAEEEAPKRKAAPIKTASNERKAPAYKVTSISK